MDDKAYLDSVMKDGKDKAIHIADSVLNKVFDAVGLTNI